MRNVILVTYDSIRADHCSFMGYSRETTPTLDQVADEGLVFENAVAPGPSTPESMPVIMTGQFPTGADGDHESLLSSRQAQIRQHLQARMTLAERFKQAGYETAAFTPNPYTSTYFGFDKGFDRYEDFMTGSRAKLYQGLLEGVLSGRSLGSILPFRVLLNWIQREEVFKPWESFYDEVFRWTEQAESPYFLWVLLMDTHDPYLVPAEYRTQSRWGMYQANLRLWRQGHEPPFSKKTHDRLVQAYDDTIRYADEFLAKLRADLAEDDPLIAVHGDHGEAFGEHGTYGHHQELYEENVHVPLVVDGAEERTVRQPFTLRRIPDLLTSLALEDEYPGFESPAVACRTLDSEQYGFRGQSWKQLSNGGGTKLYPLSNGETEQVDNDEVEALVGQLTSHVAEQMTEQERISAATAALSGERL